MIRQLLATSIACLSLSLVPSIGTAQEKPQAVILQFTGSGGSSARVYALRGIKQYVSLTPRAEVEEIAGVFDASLNDPKGRKVVASELGLDYFVWGRVTGSGSKRHTEIRIAGSDGKEISAYEAPPPGKSTNNRMIQEAARLAMKDAIREAPPGKAKPVKATAKKEKKEKKKKTDKQPSQKTKADKASESPVFVLLLGGGGRVRNVKVNLDGGGVRKYESNLFGTVAAQFQIRPAARSAKRKLRGLYLQLDGQLGLGLEASPQGTPDTLDTTTYQILGQFGYLAKVGKGQVGGTVGVGFDEFDIDPNPIMASATYIYVRPAFIGQYNFVEDLFYGRLDLGFRYPFTLGDLEDAFGKSSTAFGFDAVLMFGGELDVGFTYAARIMWERYQLKFKGATAPVIDQPAAADGKDGFDQSFTFQALVGWSF